MTYQIWLRGAFAAYFACRRLGQGRRDSLRWVWRARPMGEREARRLHNKRQALLAPSQRRRFRRSDRA